MIEKWNWIVEELKDILHVLLVFVVAAIFSVICTSIVFAVVLLIAWLCGLEDFSEFNN